MQVVSAQLISGKKVLLRLDIDVPLNDGKVVDDFRLRVGLPALKLCLENAQEVIVMGHIGRPQGEDPDLSVAPIYEWLKKNGFSQELENGKLKLLENLRFEEGEDKGDIEYARQLAAYGDFYVNESFAAYHEAASTTVLPTLLPHAAGLRFFEEVKRLTEVRDNPKKSLVVIMGGAKVEDKLPVIKEMAKIADKVLVGGKLIAELKVDERHSYTGSSAHEKPLALPDGSLGVGFVPGKGYVPESAVHSTAPHFSVAADFAGLSSNVLVGQLNEAGTDITPETVESWKAILREAKMIVWNGPMGKIEEPKNFQTHELANIVVTSEAETIVGGGDTVGYLEKLGLLEKFSFVSTGGGAMLKFLETGTLPTITALQ